MFNEIQRKKYQPVQEIIRAFDEVVRSKKPGQKTIVDMRTDLAPEEAETIGLFQEYLDKEVNPNVSPCMSFGYSGLHVSQKAKPGYQAPEKAKIITSDLGRPIIKLINYDSNNNILVLASPFDTLLEEQDKILKKSLGNNWSTSGVEIALNLISPFMYDASLSIQENSDVLEKSRKTLQTLVRARMTLRRLSVNYGI